MSDMLSRLLACRMNIISSQLSRYYTVHNNGLNGSPELSYTNYVSTKVSPKDPPLLILHGLFGSKKNWESMGKALAATGRRVITVDARNHGDSSHVSDMDYMSMSDDVEKLLYKLNIHRAIILGHSMGGKTAMCLAVNRPHLVEKLIIEDVAPDTKRTALVTAFPQYLAAMRGVRFDSDIHTLAQARRTASAQLQDIFNDADVRAFVVTNIRQGAEGFEWRVNIDAIERNLDYIVGFPTLQGSYTGDTLFIGGGNSHHVRPEDQMSINSLFPNATLEMVEGAGHWVHADKPHDFLNIVKQFIGDLDT